MPPKPSAAAWRSVSAGNTSSSSHWRANRIISPWAKARAVSLMARCCSLSSKSMGATDSAGVCRRQSRANALGPGPVAAPLHNSRLLAPVLDLGLAQIELTLDPSPRLVLELAAAEEIVDVLPLGLDQQELDIAVQLDELLVRGVAIAAVLGMPEPLPLMRVQRPHKLLGQIAPQRELLQSRNPRLDRLPPGMLLLDPLGVALAAADMSEAERP